MAAFVVFIRSYGIWIYLVCVLGIVVGVKWLIDARRLSRTTLFSLEQERANDQSYRALLAIAISLVILGMIAFVNIFIAPNAPTTESPIARLPTSTLAPLVFPSSTPTPVPTPTVPVKATEAPPVIPGSPQPTATRTVPVVRPTNLPAPTITPTPGLPAPTLVAPPNTNVFSGYGQANAAMTFKWTWVCPQCQLGPNDKFFVVISYTNKNGQPITIAGPTTENFIRMADILRGGVEVWQQAKEDAFKWHVIVKRGDQPISAPSATWSFTWH